MTPPAFVSGDWGTSRLRLRLVRLDPFEILAEAAADEGIARVFADWRDAGEPADREGFYLRRLLPVLDALRAASAADLTGLPLVLSGMATATIGLRELPYAPSPFALSGESLPTATIPPGTLPAPTLLISGVRAESDVMRGEETIVLGLQALGLGDGLYLLPGTHSKHVDVRDRAIVGFRTYLTGELFALLRDHSVLRPCLAEAAGPDAPFVRGVREAASTNWLHELFALRARSVLGAASPGENGARLSGLLIGHELADLRETADDDRPIHLAADEPLIGLYEVALRQLGLGERVRRVGGAALAMAVARGQARLLDRLDDRRPGT